jgi:hypothetical protein
MPLQYPPPHATPIPSSSCHSSTLLLMPLQYPPPHATPIPSSCHAHTLLIPLQYPPPRATPIPTLMPLQYPPLLQYPPPHTQAAIAEKLKARRPSSSRRKPSSMQVAVCAMSALHFHSALSLAPSSHAIRQSFAEMLEPAVPPSHLPLNQAPSRTSQSTQP